MYCVKRAAAVQSLKGHLGHEGYVRTDLSPQLLDGRGFVGWAEGLLVYLIDRVVVGGPGS